MPISVFPPAPQRAEPATFADKADAFLGHLEGTFVPEINALQTDVNTKHSQTLQAAQDAIQAAAAAVFAGNITAWQSGFSYAMGQTVYSPINFQTYRARTAHSGVIDPSDNAASANWERISLDVSQYLPAGSVIHVAATTAPTNYLKANGAAVSRTAYAALFAAIGTTFGVGDGSTTFNLPDLRGEFLRGWDDGRGVDSGRGMGSGQEQGVQPHAHTTGTALFNSNSPTAYAGYPDDNATRPRSISNSTAGGETRPRNVALLACIKY